MRVVHGDNGAAEEGRPHGAEAGDCRLQRCEEGRQKVGQQERLDGRGGNDTLLGNTGQDVLIRAWGPTW